MNEIRMPSLGADMDAGTLVEWRIAPGDRVERGQIVAVVETQKAAVEMESFAEGVVDRLLVEPGEKVPVGTVLATLRDPGETAASPPVSAAAAPPATATPAPVEAPQVSVRAAIAAAMSRAWREIPHYYLAHSVDLGAVQDWLERYNAARPPGERMLAAALLVRAVARGVREVPELNGHFVDGAFRPAARVNVGMAIALRGGGVVAPALADADRRGPADLMDGLRDLVARARAGTLRSSELGEATITITSLGERGCEEVHGIINPPQVAMVGAGSVLERPWAVGDRVVVRPVVRLTLAADHRVSDGHRGALFLAAVDRLLQHPEDL